MWSDELATVAQNYAAMCNFDHNPNRASQQATFASVGENLFVTSGDSVDHAAAVQAWYDEVADYTYDPDFCAENEVCGRCTEGAVCGHYTQVWLYYTNLVRIDEERACNSCIACINSKLAVLPSLQFLNLNVLYGFVVCHFALAKWTGI